VNGDYDDDGNPVDEYGYAVGSRTMRRDGGAAAAAAPAAVSQAPTMQDLQQLRNALSARGVVTRHPQ
jgi:hypothetical protein